MNEERLRAAKEIVARNVRAIRISKGLTQLELANRAGLVRQKISEIEMAAENMTLGTMTKVADALEVDLATLVSEE